MNDAQIWSWVVTIIGIIGFIFVGRKEWWAWYINVGNQALWMTYAIVTQQYGFILASLFYTAVFGKNAYAWTKDHFRPKHPGTPKPIGRITQVTWSPEGVVFEGVITETLPTTWSFDSRMESIGIQGISTKRMMDYAAVDVEMTKKMFEQNLQQLKAESYVAPTIVKPVKNPSFRDYIHWTSVWEGYPLCLAILAESDQGRWRGTQTKEEVTCPDCRNKIEGW